MRDRDQSSREVLGVDDDEKYGIIESLISFEVDDDFNSYLNTNGYGSTIEDRYGDRIKYVLARDLKTVGLSGPVGAFVSALNDMQRIALYWC